MHSGVRLFSIKPPDNWPIAWLRVPTARPAPLRVPLPVCGFPFGEELPVRHETIQQAARVDRETVTILANVSRRALSADAKGGGERRRGAGASGSKCFGVEPSVPLFLYKLRAKHAYAYVVLG